jgi:hypothetical protein
VYRLVDSETDNQDDVRIALDLAQFLREFWVASWDAGKHFRDHPENIWTLPVYFVQGLTTKP